jgi:hypothetical protein
VCHWSHHALRGHLRYPFRPGHYTHLYVVLWWQHHRPAIHSSRRREVPGRGPRRRGLRQLPDHMPAAPAVRHLPVCHWSHLVLRGHLRYTFRPVHHTHLYAVHCWQHNRHPLQYSDRGYVPGHCSRRRALYRLSDYVPTSPTMQNIQLPSRRSPAVLCHMWAGCPNSRSAVHRDFVRFGRRSSSHTKCRPEFVYQLCCSACHALCSVPEHCIHPTAVCADHCCAGGDQPLRRPGVRNCLARFQLRTDLGPFRSSRFDFRTRISIRNFLRVLRPRQWCRGHDR